MTNNESSNMVIVAYKPKPGKSDELKQLVNNHVPELARLGLVTDRKPVIAETGDGTIIEVFEWISADAIKLAHGKPEVQKIWADFAECCDCIPLNTVAEAGNMFASFKPLN